MGRRLGLGLGLGLWLGLSFLFGGASLHARPASAAFWSPQQGESHLLVISGIGGEPRYRETFHEWAVKLAGAAVERHGVPRANVTVLAEQPERDPLIAGKVTKAEVERAFASLSERTSAGDVVFVVLIGHGSFEGGEARFNLSGPDLTAQDFAALVARLEGRNVAFVNTASASGEFIRQLSGPGRVIVTSTKSGQERNESIFGGHFVEAYAGDGADTDKDGRVSLLEAFTYARLQVEREYQQSNRLLTEHAVFDDNADAAGSAEPDASKGEGALARTTFLGPGAAVAAAPDSVQPALRALLAEKQRIEQQIEALRARKDTMETAAYERELERLLVELAMKDQEIRSLQGRR